MSVRRAIAEKDEIYFITFTCKNWLPLFELTNGYDAVYEVINYKELQDITLTEK